MSINKKFVDKFINVSAKAALSSFYLVGKKDKVSADKAAVDSMRIELNKIYGCSSQAWVVATANEDKTFSFHTDSDALIVKGLLFILEQVYNDRTADEILSVNSQYILQSIGLEGSVTSQRNNGFASAVNKIHELVR